MSEKTAHIIKRGPTCEKAGCCAVYSGNLVLTKTKVPPFHEGCTCAVVEADGPCSNCGLGFGKEQRVPFIELKVQMRNKVTGKVGYINKAFCGYCVLGLAAAFFQLANNGMLDRIQAQCFGKPKSNLLGPDGQPAGSGDDIVVPLPVVPKDPKGGH